MNESIRDYVFAFVCRTNWGKANALKNLADLASKCWVPKKSMSETRAIQFDDGTQYNYELTASESRKYHRKGQIIFFYTNQKCCKGSEFHGCLGLQTSKNQRDRSPDVTLFLVVNVGKYTIHGSYGFCFVIGRKGCQGFVENHKLASGQKTVVVCVFFCVFWDRVGSVDVKPRMGWGWGGGFVMLTFIQWW